MLEITTWKNQSTASIAVIAAPPLKYKSGMSERRLRKVVEYIGENLSSNLSLTELAAVVGTNRFHFCREFKRLTGETPHRFVVRCRVAYAACLLLETNEPIVQIALAAGFPDQSHLTRWFKRLTRQTPAEFRRGN